MDPDGRGRLYRIDTDGSYCVLLDDVACSNGMGFTPDRRQLYFTESLANTIWLFDYDAASGQLSGRRPFVRRPPPALPDGMTVDAAGNVWSAVWNGFCVTCYGPDGAVQRIALPTGRITSVAFGGAELGNLYVTAATDDAAADQYSGVCSACGRAHAVAPSFPRASAWTEPPFPQRIFRPWT